jgi:ubiquinone biosynthesis protein UbiJ
MAVRKMTFSLPADLAATFTRRVPARERSRYLAEALAYRLEERDRLLIAACEIANRDADVRSIEQEFDRLSDEIAESWTPIPATRR